MDDTKDFSETTADNTADKETNSAISADLIRGHINTIILRTLYERDKYGYEIIEEIEKKSHGQYSLKQPTLYSALKRLETQGYINAYWKTDEVSLGGRRKYYTLTDSGREITEKNQAEWEYSRTVIDNLISDRSFDFSQPAPTSVDFKILKKSTSRVPVVKDEDDEDDEDDDVVEANEIKEEKPAPAPAPAPSPSHERLTEVKLPEVEVKHETATFTEQTVVYETTVAPASSTTPTSSPAQPQQPVAPVQPQQQTQPVEEKIIRPVQEDTTMSEEQRRIVHENYLRLISEPAPKQSEEVDVVPVADEINTEKLIYNNKPETERDYRNLINNLFNQTVSGNQRTTAEPHYEEQPASSTVKLEDIASKAENDGLKISASDFVVNTRKKSYSRGGTLFKSSLIVAIIMLLEFTLCLIFKDDMGVNLAYPFVIFALAAAQLLIFGVLYYTDLGKLTRKPTSTLYLSACIIVTVILIVIIFIVSILLNVNYSSAGDIMAKIIVPCFIALNIPLFAGCFYLLSK